MIPRWTQEVARSLSTGRPTTSLEQHLDTLLLWLSNPDNPRAANLDAAIRRAGMSRRHASSRAYGLLDRLLFTASDRPSPRTLGLAANTDPSLAKRRYRRLIQVYHPDRHATRTSWATQRSEQINRAFDTYRRGLNKKRSASPATGPKGHGRPATRQGPRASPLRSAVQGSRAWLGSTLETTRPFRNPIAAALLAIGLTTVVLVGFDERPTRHPIDTPVAEQDAREPGEPVRLEISAANPTETETQLVEMDSEPDTDTDTDTDTDILAQAERKEKGEVNLDQSTGELETAAVDDVSDQADAAPLAPTARASDDTRPSAPTETRPDASSGANVAPLAAITPASKGADPSSDAPREQKPDATRAQTTQTPLNRTPQPSPEWTFPLESGMKIQSATPPSPPEPPTRPHPPLQVSRSTLAQPAIAEPEPAQADCRPVLELLTRFQETYEAGALDPFMALYSPAAQENDLASWFSIRQTYAEWFAQTSARRITFDRLHIQPVGKARRCAAIAAFQVVYLDTHSNLVTNAGVIELLFEPKGPDLRILRVRY